MRTISDITPYGIEIDEEWVDVRATVKSLRDEPPHPKMSQFGALTDGDRTLPFVNWEASDQPDLELGDTYVLHDAYRDLYDGDQRVVLRSDTEVEVVEEPTTVEQSLGWAARRGGLEQYGDTLFITPVIENVYDTLKRFVFINGDRDRAFRHYDYTATQPGWADCHHSVRITPTGLELDFDLDIDPDGYRNKFRNAEPETDAAVKTRNTERKLRDRIYDFVAEFDAIEGADVVTEGEVICGSIRQCADCGESLYGKPTGKNGEHCGNEDCDARNDPDIEQATIPRRIRVTGTVGPTIDSLTDLERAVDEIGGRLKWSTREAMGVVAERVERDGAVADNDGETSIRFDTRKDWNTPKESYTAMQAEFPEPVGPDVVGRVCGLLDSVGVGTKLVAYDDSREAGNPYDPFEQEETTLKVVSSTMVTEYSRYSSLDAVIEENEEHQPDTFVVLVDDHRRHVANLLNDGRFELRHI